MTTEQKHTPEPPLTGRWHHGNGNLVCGTIRVAVEDFDTHPSEKVKTEVLDWICHVLNEATKDHTLAAKVKELELALKNKRSAFDELANISNNLVMELVRTNAQRDELLKFAKHRNDAGAFCGLLKHPEYGCTCGYDALIAKIEAEKATKE